MMNEPPNHAVGSGSVYRAYRIDACGRVETATPIDAETDEQAIAQAHALLDGHAIEVWDRGRKIILIEPETPSDRA